MDDTAPTGDLVQAVTELTAIQERDTRNTSDGATGDSGSTNDGNFH